MRYKPNELERLSMTFDAPMKRLEDEIMTDIVRRIRINSEITRSADWQIHRLYELGMSRQDIEKRIQELTGISPQEVRSLYSQILEKGYAEDEKIYNYKGKPYIPFEENEQLQQLISATANQTSESMQNITQSLGFAVKNADGKTEFLPIAKYYQSTLDNAMLGITSGAFDYNTVLKKTVAQLTNSGLRTIDYASGHSNRVEVAARRAVMTGFNQVVAKVNEENADKLETEYFEVSWHGGARPTHQVWQGRVYSKKDLETVCGLGDVQGLCGANCYHSYHPFDPEIDVRTYTDEQLDEMNRQENTPVEFGGKQYTKYEALQRQRRLETTMRAERQKIRLLQEGGADEDDIIIARAKYRVTSSEYTRFSKAMNLPQQRERVTVDGLGNIGVGKYKLPVEKMAVQYPKGFVDVRKVGNPISKEDLENFVEKAKIMGVTLATVKNSKYGGFDTYCGDTNVLNDMLEHIKINQNTLKKISGNDKIIIGYQYLTDSGAVDVGTFACTRGKTILFNKFMYDDSNYLKSEYSKMVELGHFAKGTTYKNIVDHEFGHIFARNNKRYLSGLRQLCEQRAKKQGITLSEYITKNISLYAEYLDELPAEINSMRYGSKSGFAITLLKEAGLI